MNNKFKFELFRFHFLFFIIVFIFSLGYYAFINYQLYSQKGNGSGSPWLNWKNEFNMIEIIREEKKANTKSNIIITSFARNNYNAPILLLSKANYCMDYSSIIAGKFNFKSADNILYIYVSKYFTLENNSALLQNGDMLLSYSLANGNLLKFKLK